MDFDSARRRFLYQSLTGVGGLALLDLAVRETQAASLGNNPLAPKPPHHEPKAKSCIFLTMLGGVSQMDTFDPKPALEKFDKTVMDWNKEKNTDQPNLFAKPRLILRSTFPDMLISVVDRGMTRLAPARIHIRTGRNGLR